MAHNAPVEHRAFGDQASLATAVAGWLHRSVAHQGGRYVALAVGDSTLPGFAALGPLPPGRTVICLDELVPAPANQGATFAARLRKALPRTWAAALVPFEGEFADPGRIEAAVAAGGIVAAVCGVGPDGHVAFNQPPDDGTSRTRVVELTPSNLGRLGDVRPATHAVTLGLATLGAARRIAVVVAGEGKQDALRRLVDGPAGADCPVSMLRAHPALAVFSLVTP